MVRERSAGVIVFRHKRSAPRERVFLLLDYGRYWDLPKGHLKKGENDREAALRELEEETGIDDAELFDAFKQEMSYWFRDRKKGLIHKQVIFFLAETRTKQIKLSDEHTDSIWLPLEEAIEKLTYKNAKELMREAGNFLASSAS